MTDQTPRLTAPDNVECIIAQWRAEGLPEDQLIAMETIGRIKRLEIMIMKQLASLYQEHFQLTHWEFDVLATLRRSGKPYCLSPTQLFDSMMVSSGAMTNRLHHLEKKQWIHRIPHPEDKRSLLVQLTHGGLQLINEAIRLHITAENDMLAGLAKDELLTLNKLLKKMESDIKLIKKIPQP